MRGAYGFLWLAAPGGARGVPVGRVFIRIRPRRAEDGLTVPLQLQVLPSEMLPWI
jgi:hypothetical protein